MITFATFSWYELLCYKEIPNIYWMTRVHMLLSFKYINLVQ